MFLWFCELFIRDSHSQDEKTEKLKNIRIPITYLCSDYLCKENEYYSVKKAKKIQFICPGCSRMLYRT
jgi:hypothetical protein